MDNTEVKYTLILEGLDRLEKGMQSGHKHAMALGEAMGHLKNEVIGLIGAYAGFEVLKESFQEFEQHKVAVSTLTQMYNNNRDSVKMTIEQLTELAEKQETLTGVHSEVTMAAEQNLMKYKDIKVSYEELIPLSADLAKGLGTDTADAANMLGRAMENPLRAMRLLMQTGASPEQLAMFQNLEKTGHAAKAQAYLVEILGDKYKGLAKAAFDADISAQFEVGFKQVKESIGSLIELGFVKLMPYIKEVFTFVKTFVKWIEDHMGIIKMLGTIVLTVAGAFAVYNIALKGIAIWEVIVAGATSALSIVMTVCEAVTLALADGMGVLEAVQWALNIAMEANPIGIIVVGLAALTAGVIYAYTHFETFRRTIWAIWSVFKDLWHITFEVGKIMFYLSTLQFSKMIASAKDIANTVASIGTNAASAYNAPEAVTDAGKKLDESKIPPDKKGKTPSESLSQSDKVTGTKQVVINVSIGKLVEKVEVYARNLKEGINQAAPDIAKALLGAVNQFSTSTDI